jgi:hypothetical protein
MKGAVLPMLAAERTPGAIHALDAQTGAYSITFSRALWRGPVCAEVRVHLAFVESHLA